jgi:hypothetical protein
MPLDFVVKKVLKSRSALSAENPAPQPVTESCTCCAHRLHWDILVQHVLMEEVDSAVNAIQIKSPEEFEYEPLLRGRCLRTAGILGLDLRSIMTHDFPLRGLLS